MSGVGITLSDYLTARRRYIMLGLAQQHPLSQKAHLASEPFYSAHFTKAIARTMVNLSIFTIVFLSTFAFGLPSGNLGDTTSDERRITDTNASRLARGMPPLTPKRKWDSTRPRGQSHSSASRTMNSETDSGDAQPHLLLLPSPEDILTAESTWASLSASAAIPVRTTPTPQATTPASSKGTRPLGETRSAEHHRESAHVFIL